MEIFRSVAELRGWSRICRAGSTAGVLEEHDASQPRTRRIGSAPGALKGHDFSRAVTGIEARAASAAEGISSNRPDGSNALIGLVPTMGALHQGHASLIRDACARCAHVAVSIFVNPTQFGPNEDYARYPRSFEADCRLAEAEGAGAIFAPSVEEMYPPGATTFVEVAGLSDRLDGASRPGHFCGVATVVAKLFIAAEPDLAFFGQKDAAQVSVLRRMVADLRLGLEIVVCPIVREPDGLALSSRNAYLIADERRQARTLSQAVRWVEAMVTKGERNSAALIEAARQIFAAEPHVRVDYIALVDWATLEPVEVAAPGTLFAVAAWVGTTRLIDNAILE